MGKVGRVLKRLYWFSATWLAPTKEVTAEDTLSEH